MLIVGLTGGIGSGKSTVASLFAKHNVPIIDADEIAHQLTKPDQPAFSAILEHFSRQILQKNGELDRRKLREIIFNQENEKNWLENLLHPLIYSEIQYQLHKLTASYCIVVIPLLVEVASYPFIDRILVVDAPLTHQIDRVTKRDHALQSQVQTIINTQINRETRLEHAHDVIVNDGNIQDLLPQVEALHKNYLEISKN